MITALASLLSVSAIMANTVSAAPLAHGRQSFGKLAARAPDNWWTGLEPYNVYHDRYLSFACQDHHETEFFPACCHPLLKDQNVAELSSQCQAGGPVASQIPSTEAPEVEVDVEAEAEVDLEAEAEVDLEVEAEVVSTSASESSVVSEAIETPVVEASPAPAPEPTTEAAPAPAPQVNAVAAEPAPEPAYEAPAENNNNGGGSGSFTGHATYFHQNGVAGACGTVHGDYDNVIALETSMYAGGSNCGKTVTIHRGGKTVTAKVADMCPSCISGTSIDLSVGAFQALGTQEEGMFDVTWSFN